MTLIEIFSILLIHWFADFVLQTEKQAKGKSKEWYPLIEHTFVYSVVWFIVGAFLCVFDIKYLSTLGLFVQITFIAHTITDYFTSRITSKKYKNNHFYGFNGFWFWIGMDQVLHYIQLFTTYYFLI